MHICYFFITFAPEIDCSGTSGHPGQSGHSGLSGQAGSSGYAARYDRLRAFCKEHSDLPEYEPYFTRWTDEEMCNTAICLCHMVDKAMTTFIENRDREFVEEGGIRERMTAARLDMRGTQKQIIAQQAQEIAQLRAKVASLQRELNTLIARQN